MNDKYMARSEEYNKRLDLIVNGLNVALIVVASIVMGFGVYYIIQDRYSYLVTTGLILVLCALIGLVIGGWGFYKHYRMIKKMKRQAEMDLNY